MNEPLYNERHQNFAFLGPDLTWKQIIALLQHQNVDIFPDSLRKFVADRLGENTKRELAALDELGIFSEMVRFEATICLR